jgi:hypothetical protein
MLQEIQDGYAINVLWLSMSRPTAIKVIPTLMRQKSRDNDVGAIRSEMALNYAILT